MPIDHQPAHAPFLEPQCVAAAAAFGRVAAAAAFGRASLRKFREAHEQGGGNTPEGAMKLKLSEIFSDCMKDMTRLAVELAKGGKRHAQD